jgi:hypothetical protein
MTKFHGLILAGLIGLLAVCAPPAQAAAMQPSGTIAAAIFPVSSQVSPVKEQTAPPGPVLNPAGTTEADAQKSKNKLIAGGVAIVLLLLVLWGRRLRNPKPKKE